MSDLLRVRDLHVSIALPELTIDAVRGIDFRVRQGSTVALVGESGAGKSITAQAVMGLMPRGGRVTAGQILFRDPTRGGAIEDLARLDPDSARMQAIRGRHISMVFQEPMSSFSPLHSIGDQIAEAYTVHRQGGDAAGETRALLAQVGFPEPTQAFDAYPFELSGGLRQRAMIAMALICRPSLVIADEPTTALDVTTQAQILKLICDLQRSFGMAVLIITHDLGVVANLADEIVVLYRGEVVEAGARDDIFGDPQHPYLKALLGAVPRIGLDPGTRLRPVHDAATPPDGMPAPHPKRPPAATPAPLLELIGLRKSFRQRAGFLWRRHDQVTIAVDGVTLTVNRGETLGLVGESGSGKSTLAKLIMRATPPDSGEIRYHKDDRVLDALTLDRDGLADYRRRVQYIFQDPFSALDPRMTVQDIITEPLEIHRVGTRRSRADEARDLMRLVGLDPRLLNRYPHSFSGGQRQRVGIARALALRPELLICDEPVSALDVGIQAQILNLLRELQDSLGLTYLFVSHNLAVVDYLADRIAVMCCGRIVELAPRQAIFESPLHPYTRELLAVVPDTRLDRPLDFSALGDAQAADPASWHEPFREDGTRPLRLHEFAEGHYVRADADISAGELRT